jgi:metal-responsive CopG/Arc/MetJ family transcriptional regulator
LLQGAITMKNVTVNISFSDTLLAEIDAEAKRESRSRSELLREAARLYVQRRRQWDDVFSLGDRLTTLHALDNTAVEQEILAVRSRKG